MNRLLLRPSDLTSASHKRLAQATDQQHRRVDKVSTHVELADAARDKARREREADLNARSRCVA